MATTPVLPINDEFFACAAIIRLLFGNGNFVRWYVNRCPVATFNSVGDGFLPDLPIEHLAFTHQDAHVLTRFRIVNETFAVIE